MYLRLQNKYVACVFAWRPQVPWKVPRCHVGMQRGDLFFFWSQMSVFLMWQVHRGSGHRPQSARATAYRDGVSLPRQYLEGRVSSPVRQGWLSEPKTCRSRGGDMQKQQALI